MVVYFGNVVQKFCSHPWYHEGAIGSKGEHVDKVASKSVMQKLSVAANSCRFSKENQLATSDMY